MTGSSSPSHWPGCYASCHDGAKSDHREACPTRTAGYSPDARPASPSTPNTCALKRLGIPIRPARQAALLQLARQVPAPVLADLLGISITNATGWVARAGGTWHHYAADRLRHPQRTRS